jgi:hypothetical protein
MYESYLLGSMNMLYPRLVIWNPIWVYVCMRSGTQLEGSSQGMSQEPAIVQASSDCFLTVDACVQSHGSTFGICGGQSDMETGFAPSTSV